MVGSAAGAELIAAVNQGIGTRCEAAGLDLLERSTAKPVLKRNDQGFASSIRAPGFVFKLYGKIDGLQDDVVVEHKQRQNHFMGRVIERERIQLYVYLFLTRRRRGLLVETFGGVQRHDAVEWDQRRWDGYHARIVQGMTKVHTTLRCPAGKRQLVEHVTG